MADPRDASLPSIVEASYVAAADRARRAVAAAFDLEEMLTSVLASTAQRRYRVVWRIRLDEGAALPVKHLLLAMPWTFPDELPDVYLPEEVTRAGARIPHLDEQHQLCTFDDTTAWPNEERAGEAVCAVIERAIHLLRDGISGANADDYADEFEAYWLDGALKPVTALSIVRPEGPHRRIVSVRLSSPLGPHTLVFAEEEQAALVFLDGIGRVPPKPKVKATLYLHLNGLGGPPNIVTNSDVLRRIGSDPSAREALLKFLGDEERPSTVLFSIPARTERVFGAWIHPRFGTDVFRGKGSRRVMDQAPGFRPGHLPPEVELTSTFASLRLDRVIVQRADEVRLATRTAGAVEEKKRSFGVIGCGSVGGFVADTIRHVHPSRIRLVDPQHLEVHNVPRHYCDLTAVGENKARAVRAALRRFDPHLDVRIDDRDVLEILRVEPDALTPADYTFVAVASMPVERRLNVLSRQLALGTVAYLWIEPHAVAGHAVVVPPSARGCFECLLDPDLSIAVRVLQHPEQFERADAGCRGSFLPYSGLDAQAFARTITRGVLEYGDTDIGSVVTWIGDIDRARREGWAIHDDWSKATPFSLSRRPIQARADCPVCGQTP
jgi:hypothetical protein